MLFLSVCKCSDYFWFHQIKSHLFMNKMHFYCFLPSFINRFHRFHWFFVFIIGWTWWTLWLSQCNVWSDLVHLVIIFFLRVLRILWLIHVAHPGARTRCHAFPWWALCCWLSSRTPAASKQKYLDYDMCSRRWSRTTARPCRARDGVVGDLSAIL